MKTVIQTPKAPAAIGPYSQAIAVGDMIYTSGMIPIIPETGELETGDVKAQAKQAIGCRPGWGAAHKSTFWP